MTKNRYKAIYDGSEVIVAGQLESGISELEPTVQAFCADPNDHRKVHQEIRYFFNFQLYPAHSRVGRGNIVLNAEFSSSFAC